MKRSRFAYLIAVGVLLLSLPSMADTISSTGPNGETLTLVLVSQSGNTYNFSLTIGVSGTILTSAFLDSISVRREGVTLLAGSGFTLPAELNQFNLNQQVNNSGSDIGCGGGGAGWMCGEVTNPGALPLSSGSITINFTIVTNDPLPLDFLQIKIGYSDGTTGGPGDQNKVGAIVSQGVPVIPEPSTLILFGSGLLGTAGALRRRYFS